MGTTCLISMYDTAVHENYLEFCVDFTSIFSNAKFFIKKNKLFLKYANLCKLGDYTVEVILIRKH